MLHEEYARAKVGKKSEWKKLEHFFNLLDIKRSAFISMNWDTVIERGLAERRKVTNFEYRCGAQAAQFRGKNNVVSAQSSRGKATSVPVIKMHGSVNWLYCDNCRQLYWFTPDDGLRVAMQLITPDEARDLNSQTPKTARDGNA